MKIMEPSDWTVPLPQTSPAQQLRPIAQHCIKAPEDWEGMGLVEAAHEQQVGDLLDHLERIGDAARPEGIPHIVDLGSQFAS